MLNQSFRSSLTLLVAASAFCPAALAQTFPQACDGSAIVSVGKGYFLNASDEDNIIRLYRVSNPAKPLREYTLTSFLKPELTKKGAPKETDLEAVAQIGTRLYWIGSHGADKKGDPEPSRLRFFATDIATPGATTSLKPAGKPYQNLLADLIAAKIEATAALSAAQSLPHQKGGIDIEGMAATPSGALLVGFRSPLVGGKALLALLTNPKAVVAGTAKAAFGKNSLLDLNGMGIRDIIPTAKPGEFYILAGAPGVEAKFAIYQWQLGGVPKLASLALPNAGGSPEALMIDNPAALYVALDGGEQGTPVCKDRDVKDRSFLLQQIKQ